MPESKPKGEVKKTVTEKNTPKIIPMAGEKKPEPPKKEEVPKPTTPGEKKPELPKKEEAPKPTIPGEKKPELPKKEEAPKPTAPGEKKPEPPKKEEAPKPAAPGEKKPELPKKEEAPKPAAPGEKKPEPPKKEDIPKSATPGVKKPEPSKKEDTPKPAAPGEKKPEPPKKEEAPKPAAPGEKKPEPPKKEEAPKPAAPGEKKPEPPKKEDAPKPTAPGEKKPEPPKKEEAPKPAIPTEKPKEAPAIAPQPKDAAVIPPKGVRITQILADRLEKPTEADLKKMPQPKEGEGISMQLHPGYFFEFLDHPFSVNRETQDYKELFDSIKENGINEPIKARPREGGGLELISGHRRHDVAKQLNYPVPVVIVQMDDDSAKIEVVDGNLHRQDIPTSELARAAKMKMEALSRKVGRRSKMEQLANGPQKRTDQIVAEEMGMSRNQVQRLVRIDALIPELKQKVDDKTLPFNTAVELSHLNATEQRSVADFMAKEQVVPSLAQAQELKGKSQEAAKAAKEEAEKAGKVNPIIPKPSSPTAPLPTTEKKSPAPVTDKTVMSVMMPKKEPAIKVIFTGDELRSYFEGKQPSVPDAKRAIFDALDMRKAELAKQAQRPGKTTPTR